MLELRYFHPRTAVEVEIRQAVRVPRNLPVDLKIGERAGAGVLGRHAAGCCGIRYSERSGDRPRRGRSESQEARGGTPKVTPQWLWPSKLSKYRQEPHVRFWLAVGKGVW